MLLFRGRLRPNIQRDPNQPLEIFFTRPTWARQLITVKVKELDTYRDPQNRQISEGTEDDLLATFTGRILRTARRRFQVESHTNESDDAELPTIKIKFEGSETVYDVPVVSEEGESEGMNWEIAFTVEYPGQRDYNSPVSFIPRAQGRVLVVDNTTSDLSSYESHANLVRHYFTSRGMQGKILRGAKSNTTTAHYNAADTDHYYGGFERKVFENLAGDYDYLYFNCHGYVDLENLVGSQQGDPCTLCANRFSHNSFGTCSRDLSSTPAVQKCNTVDRRGFFFYTHRENTNVNAEIDLNAASGEWLQFRLPDRAVHRVAGPFVDWDEYGPKFFTANDTNTATAGIDNPLIHTNPATPRMIDGVSFPGNPTYDLRVPNRFQFPTLAAFPATGVRPDFREENLRTSGGNRVQDPESSYLHHSTAHAVPGVPIICFMGEGGPLSAEVSATPAAGAAAAATPAIGPATVFTTAPQGVVATARDGRIILTWNKVQDAEKYSLYWSTTAGIRESDVSSATCQDTNVIHNIFAAGTYSQPSFSVNATPTAGNPVPNPPAAGAATAFGAPTGIQATAGDGQNLVSWNPVQGAESYMLYCSTDAAFSSANLRVIRNIQGTHYRDTGLTNGTAIHYGVYAAVNAVTYNHTGRTNGTAYRYRVRAIKPSGDLVPSNWSGMGLSRVKVVYAGCCLSGRKTVLADAILGAGAKFFIGHQVVTGGIAEGLINRFWDRWLRRGAILRNLINIYDEVLRLNAAYRRTRPVIYYRNAANQTQFWRFGMAMPTDIKVD